MRDGCAQKWAWMIIDGCLLEVELELELGWFTKCEIVWRREGGRRDGYILRGEKATLSCPSR